MIEIRDADGAVLFRVPDMAAAERFDLTGLTTAPAAFDDPMVPDLATAKARQRAMINAARDAAQLGGADTPSGRFDTAPESLIFLNGEVSAAREAITRDEPYVVEWTKADGTEAVMDAEDTISAGLAVRAHIYAMHQRARVLKARIEAADTAAAVAAVVWSLSDD